MAHVVSTVAYLEPFEFISTADVLVTGKVTGDWTKTLFKDGAKVVSPPTITVTEVSGADGTYAPNLTPVAAGQYKLALSIVHGGKTYRFSEPFEVETAAQDDPGTAYGWTSARFAKLDLLGTATAVALSPVNTTATVITIERGDDETIAISEPSAGWSSLVSAASVTLTLINRVNATVLSVAGTVTSTTPGSQAVSFTLTDAQTDALRIGTAAYRFNVKAVIASGDDETLALGTVNVRHGA